MNTFIKTLIMKYILILTLLLTTGCFQKPYLADDDPFIVKRIKAGQKYCCYVSYGDNGRLQAPCGLYNIGDTIKLYKQ